MLKASDIMTRDVVMVKGFFTVDQAVRLMREKQIHTLVVDRRTEMDPYGLITDADIVYEVAAYGLDPKLVRVYEIMTKPCISVPPSMGIEYVARLFQHSNIRIAPVIGDTLMGVISITDILQKGDFLDKPKAPLLKEQITAAIESARATCQQYGPNSPQCAAAWDIVEELQAEAAHQRAEVLDRTAFQEYCEEFPEALEARIYES
jgi:CBS domain-containing protein